MLVADAPWHCLGIIQISLTAHSTSLRVISDEEPTWSPHPTKRPPTSSHPKRHHLPARRFPNAPSKNGLPVIRARRLCSPGNYLDSSCMSTDAVASIVHVWMCRWKEENAQASANSHPIPAFQNSTGRRSVRWPSFWAMRHQICGAEHRR